jgi:hypothetical protein
MEVMVGDVTMPNTEAHRNDLENWLRNEVVAVYDAIERNPQRARSVADVRASLAAEHTIARIRIRD